MKKLLLFIFSFTLLSSCIGKVEDANAELTQGVNTGSNIDSYEGIVDAIAISHDKVEVFFLPSNLEPADVTYVINYDGAINPITVPGQTLEADYRGYLRYTVNNLDINTTYIFNVQARDIDGAQSVNDAQKSTSTFANVTANFHGIGEVKNLSGSDSKNSLLIEWPSAEITGGFIADDTDPAQYEVIAVNSDYGTPAIFDDTSFESPTRIVSYVSSTKVNQQLNGLLPGSIYYIRVRAIHHGYNSNGSDPDYRKEENTRYLIGQTLSDDAADINVDTDSFRVEVPSNSTGKSSFNLEWSQGIGAIDHYRVYYKKSSQGTDWATYKSSKDDQCDGVEDNDSEYYCKKVSYDSSQTKIVELEAYTDYDIYLLLCLDSTCSLGNYIEYNVSSSYRTAPPNASFGGIEEILPPTNYWAQDEIVLVYDEIDLSSGVMDGLLVEVKARSTSEPFTDTYLNHPDTTNSTSINISTTDILTNTELKVRGLLTESAEEYCFSLIPFVYLDDVVTPDRSSESTSCTIVRVNAPSLADFGGLSGNLQYDSGTMSATVNWLPPTAGVYDKYIVFVKTDNSAFQFSDAVAGDSSYLRFEVDYGTTSFTLPFLPSGSYQFGVLTYLTNKDQYSEYNSGILGVVVP